MFFTSVVSLLLLWLALRIHGITPYLLTASRQTAAHTIYSSFYCYTANRRYQGLLTPIVRANETNYGELDIKRDIVKRCTKCIICGLNSGGISNEVTIYKVRSNAQMIRTTVTATP